LGGMFPAAHGAVCAALLPHVIETNLRALRARNRGHDVLRRYEEVARLLTGRPQASADDAAQWTHALIRALNIPRLARYGVTLADTDAIAEAASRASSMKANPIALTPEELTAILAAAL
jgi:alcohol dehydrogenase class IV